MQNYGATEEEVAVYGEKLSVWQSLILLQAWAPLLSYGQAFVNAGDSYKKSLIVADACEWLASKTSSPLDDELVRHIGDVLKTTQGEALVRWALLKVEEVR